MSGILTLTGKRAHQFQVQLKSMKNYLFHFSLFEVSTDRSWDDFYRTEHPKTELGTYTMFEFFPILFRMLMWRRILWQM